MNLDKQWESAIAPTPKDLRGELKVKILSGPFVLWSYRFKIWLKHIGPALDYNTQDGKICGYFNVHYMTRKTLFDYDVAQNGSTWSRLRDTVRKVSDGNFLGKIYLWVWGKYRFVGYFSLTKQEPKNEQRKD